MAHLDDVKRALAELEAGDQVELVVSSGPDVAGAFVSVDDVEVRLRLTGTALETIVALADVDDVIVDLATTPPLSPGDPPRA